MSTAQRTTETELSDPAPETPSAAARPEPTWSQVAPPAGSTPPPGLVGDRPKPTHTPGTDGIKAQVVRTTPAQPGHGTAAQPDPATTQAVPNTADPADPGRTQVVPGQTAQPHAGNTPVTSTDTNPADTGKTQVVPGNANPADPGKTQVVPDTANPADPGKTQIVPSAANQADPGKTQVVPGAANQADPGKTQIVPGNANQGDPGKTQVVPGNDAGSTETTQVIPKITDAPAPAAQPQAGPAQPQPAPSAPAGSPQGATQPGQPHGGVPTFPPAPPKPANQMFPPGVPVQMYQQNHAPQPAPAAPVQPPRPPKPGRQRVGTTSPSGMVVGLLGVLISAVLTYAFDLVPAAGGFQLEFSLGKAGQLVGNLAKIGDFPLWQVPLAVLLPLLPVAQLVLVLVLCLPRTRLVGPRLMSTARLLWIIVLGVIAAYQIIVAAASATDGGTLALLGLFLVGNLIVLVALLFPHWPRDDAAPHPARR